MVPILGSSLWDWINNPLTYVVVRHCCLVDQAGPNLCDYGIYLYLYNGG